MQERYEAAAIERAAQEYWDDHDSFVAREDSAREKYYCLSMFPYPSGRLHMGHVRNYTIGDVLARFMRMQGRNVLQPMGWDAFGLPAENAAIANGVPPALWTRRNIASMRAQLRALGFAIDWTRELATCDPEYYRWNQWLFLRMLERGIAYKKTGVVNWDPVDQTVLANEQVIDGRGWRTGALVEKREIPMYYLRITDYAEELLAALDDLPGWPERVRVMQANWIGRSQGVELAFPYAADTCTLLGANGVLKVFTTRADTLFGVTFMAISPEHPLAAAAAARDPALAAFIAECRHGSTTEAELASAEKRGIDTGLHVRHPLSGENIAIWVANYVLMTYGEGAVMGVPAHDERDFAFAQRYGIPIRTVVRSADASNTMGDGAWQAQYAHEGILVDSGEFSGLTSAAAIDAIAATLERAGLGVRRVHWRLRDWGISRQRYWGCPIPLIHCERCGVVAVPDAQTQAPVDQRADYWLPVDQYVGGIEHAILHLLYSRFWTRVMRDLQLVRISEPFSNLLTQGMVLNQIYYRVGADGRRQFISPSEVEPQFDASGARVGAVMLTDETPVEYGGLGTMSKSKNNGVDPQTLVDKYGADTARLFMMFAAPPEQSLEWSDEAVQGQFRFLRRLWKAVHDHVGEGLGERIELRGRNDELGLSEPARALRRAAHQTLAKVSADIGRRRIFNTAIAAVMELLNSIGQYAESGALARAVRQETLEIAVLLLSPIVPHICHSLWFALGRERAIIDEPWPQPDAQALAQALVELIVQVNGKLRARLQLPAGTEREGAVAAALADPTVRRFVAGKAVRKAIHVPDKIVNLVV